MKKEKNIVESVNFLSEEDLLVQELDRRLSYDMLPAEMLEANRTCIKCSEVCGCLRVSCDNKGMSTCGVRG